MSEDTHPYAEAIEEVHYRFVMMSTTTDALNQAHHLIELQNAIGDLVTFHPGFSIDNGTMPWQREDDEFNA